MKDKSYLKILQHYEDCFAKHGDNHFGVDWPNKKDAETRYRVMLEVIERKDNIVTLLDFGCGIAHLYKYIKANNITDISYSGLDLSEKYIEFSENKYPELKFYKLDMLEEPNGIPEFDYIVMNGVFTEKRELSFEEMFSYFKSMIINVFPKVRSGLAFNIMSKHVDWERDDLFYLPFDVLADFLTKEISRNFVFRNDYGLYEYTTYVYK